MNPIRSCNLTAGGFSGAFPMPIVCPIPIDDPRIDTNFLGYSLLTGDRNPLQLPVGLLNTVVKRGWEPWTWTWSAQLNIVAGIYAYTVSPGPVSVGNPIIRPASPPDLTTISPLLVRTDNISAPHLAQPDFTVDANERPFWVETTDEIQPTGPGGNCPFKAAAPLAGGGGSVFPLAFNTVTEEVVGAIMVVRTTLNVSLFTPYLWSDGGAYYCAVEAMLTSEAKPASRAELAPGGNWTFDFYESPWIFTGFEEISQELLGGSATTDDQFAPEVGVLSFQDDFYMPPQPWGQIKMYGDDTYTAITSATMHCVQHYAE